MSVSKTDALPLGDTPLELKLSEKLGIQAFKISRLNPLIDIPNDP